MLSYIHFAILLREHFPLLMEWEMGQFSVMLFLYLYKKWQMHFCEVYVSLSIWETHSIHVQRPVCSMWSIYTCCFHVWMKKGGRQLFRVHSGSLGILNFTNHPCGKYHSEIKMKWKRGGKNKQQQILLMLFCWGSCFREDWQIKTWFWGGLGVR